MVSIAACRQVLPSMQDEGSAWGRQSNDSGALLIREADRDTGPAVAAAAAAAAASDTFKITDTFREVNRASP